MNKKVNILLFFLLAFCGVFTYPVNAQTRMDSLQKIKKIIQGNNIVSSERVGFALSPSKHWYAFVYLLYLASKEELEQMAHDNSSAVRIYSYYGLVNIKSPNTNSIKRELQNGKTQVNTFFGCVVEEMDVSKCSKLFGKYYYHETSIKALLASMKNNESYRNILYDDLINDRRITRYND